VKAFDKAGNEYIATLVPDASLRTVSADTKIVYAAIAVVSLVVLIALSAIFLVVRRRKKEAAEINIE